MPDSQGGLQSTKDQANLNVHISQQVQVLSLERGLLPGEELILTVAYLFQT